MANGGTNHVGGPRTPEGKAKALQNLRPNAYREGLIRKNGLFSEEMRERLRPIVLNSATLLERILSGEPHSEGVPKPTNNEVVGAFRVVAPFVMTELKPVVDTVLCDIIADVLAEDDRIPFDAIGDVVGKLIERLNNESPQSSRRASSDTSEDL